MPHATRKRCDFPGCDRGQPDEDGKPDCYTTPEGLATRELVQLDLREHVEMAHLLPIKALEAEEKKLVAQANLLNEEANRIRADRPQNQDPPDTANAATRPNTSSGAKMEKIPHPTIEEGVSEGDWGFFVAQWQR